MNAFASLVVLRVEMGVASAGSGGAFGFGGEFGNEKNWWTIEPSIVIRIEGHGGDVSATDGGLLGGGNEDEFHSLRSWR